MPTAVTVSGGDEHDPLPNRYQRLAYAADGNFEAMVCGRPDLYQHDDEARPARARTRCTDRPGRRTAN